MNSRRSIFDDPFKHVHAAFIFSLMVVFCVWALDFTLPSVSTHSQLA